MGNQARPSISIIIPTLDEELSIGFLIKQIQQVMKEPEDTEIIVVDGGSIDRTAEIARNFGAKVEVVPRGHGLGSAMRLGAESARGSILVFIGGDLAYNPFEIPGLAEPILAGSADLVLGSRFMKGSVTHAGAVAVTGRLAATFLSYLALILFRRKITDLTTSLLAIRREALTSTEIIEQQQPFTQLILLGLQRRLRIREIPVTYGARPSKARPVHKLWQSFLSLFKARLGVAP